MLYRLIETDKENTLNQYNTLCEYLKILLNFQRNITTGQKNYFLWLQWINVKYQNKFYINN